jgi:hypothetical protein
LGVFSTRTEKNGFTGFLKRGREILEKIGARIGFISLILSCDGVDIHFGGETTVRKISWGDFIGITTGIIHLVFQPS